MKKEYAIGEELLPEQAKEKMGAGYILITLDGTERAMIYKRQFATWQPSGRLQNILNFLADFTGWYIMEREDFPKKEIATRENTDIRQLNKVFFR
jgi:hypothetical protein